MKEKLLIATSNAHKLKEFGELFKELDLEVVGLADVPACIEPEETGKTFEENAKIKALGYAEQTGLITLAEDSGISCDALEGAPGIYSARFAGEQRDDLANTQKLLRLLEPLPDNCRDAYYTSAIALAQPQQIIEVFVGKVHGSIAREMRGTHGFGYDPIFYYLPFKMTFGEADPAMKQQVSHRAEAFQKLKNFLAQHWQEICSNYRCK